MKLDVKFEESSQTFKSEFGEFQTVNTGNNAKPDAVEIVTVLPLADESFRGKFMVVGYDMTDKLYICLRIDGKYEWVEFGGQSIAPVVNNTSVVGVAVVGLAVVG